MGRASLRRHHPFQPLLPIQRRLLSSTPLQVAILGPVNAGKSTLFNRLIDKEANRSYQLTVDKKKSSRRKIKGRLSPGGSTHHGSSGGQAIVSSVAGTTRDRRECWGRIGGTRFMLVDTAGIDRERLEHLHKAKFFHHDDDSALEHDMMQQTLTATAQSDLVLLLFDGRVGVTSDLLETARWLRKQQQSNHNRRILLLANKLEGNTWNHEDSIIMEHLHEATRLGFGEAIPISAQHGEGVADIAVMVEEILSERREERNDLSDDESIDIDEEEDSAEKPLQMAILGRPNVGKSTLVNALLREDRVIVGPRPGLTRDSIAVQYSWKDRPVVLVDTAGIRKRSQRDRILKDSGGSLNKNTSVDIEDMAVQDALRAMKVADVAVLVLDGGARMLHRQELAICDAVLKQGRALVVAANKMDLLVDDYDYTMEDFAESVREELEDRFPMLRRTPIVPMSSLTGEAVDNLMPVVFDARDRWARTIPTGPLNRWLAEVIQGNPPPPLSVSSGKRAVRLKYMMQTKGRPPTFLLFGNTDRLPDHYVRYLIRNFQDTFDLYGMEVRLAFKKSAREDNPFASPKARRSGSGLGGREARTKRNIQQLKSRSSGNRDATTQRRSRRKIS